MSRDIPFPQANDMEKIIKLISLDEDCLNDSKLIQKYIDVGSDRQVSYYLSALMYLGIIDRKRRFTESGVRLRNSSVQMKKVELINILLKDEFVRYAYSYQVVTSITLNETVVENMIREKYPNYSDTIYVRRASTVCSWADWIVSCL